MGRENPPDNKSRRSLASAGFLAPPSHQLAYDGVLRECAVLGQRALDEPSWREPRVSS